MAINFPSLPTINQTYTYGSTTWKWNGASWEVYAHTEEVILNIDGGTPSSTYGGISPLDCGGVV